MSEITRIKLMMSAAVSAVMSLVPGVSQGATTTQSPQVDLRPQGEISEAAVKAIMEKWKLNIEQQDEAVQRTAEFVSFKPDFIRGTRPQVTRPFTVQRPKRP
jgi:hypothetical protein